MLGARPLGISASSLFFAFGMSMSGAAAVSLAYPDTMLSPMWRINPRGHEGLVALGRPGILLMAAVSFACLGASVGLWRGHPWGRWLAMTVLGVNAMGDLLNGLLGNDPHPLIGLPIAAAMVYYLCTVRVRAFFDTDRARR